MSIGPLQVVKLNQVGSAEAGEQIMVLIRTDCRGEQGARKCQKKSFRLTYSITFLVV